MMHQHGAHARPTPTLTPAYVQTATAWRNSVRPRPSRWPGVLAMTIICACLAASLWALDAQPTGEATRIIRSTAP